MNSLILLKASVIIRKAHDEASIIFVVAAIVAIVAFFVDLNVMKEQASNSAWQLIALAPDQNVGNIGASRALQQLAGEDIPLNDVKLPGAFLRKLKLQGANLVRAQFGTRCINPVLEMKSSDAQKNSKASNWESPYKHDCWIKDLQNIFQKTENEKKLYQKVECERYLPTDMLKSEFIESNMVYANFFGATLIGAEFSSSCLYKANFSGADLTKAKFEKSILQNATFVGTLLDVNETTFKGADLGGADFRLSVCHNHKEQGSFRRCTKKDVEKMVNNASNLEEIVYPGKKSEQVVKSKSEEMRCTEDHGYEKPNPFRRHPPPIHPLRRRHAA